MCHFYANPLALLCDTRKSGKDISEILQGEHFQAIRTLPSFHILVERLLNEHGATRARDILEDDQALLSEVECSLETRGTGVVKLIRRMCVLSAAAVEPLGNIELYLKAMRGTLNDSDAVRDILDKVKRMSPESLLSFIKRIEHVIEVGNPEADIDGWLDEEPEFLEELRNIQSKLTFLAGRSAETGIQVRSSYAAHSKAMRATVVAQKVQLSYEKSTLSDQDLEFTALIDQLLEVLKLYFVFDNPQHMFLSEAWVYDSILPYRDVFTPRPRFAIERALIDPQDYLLNCEAEADSLSSANPPTANLYQMYLESGSLINISDLWTAFLSMVGGEDGEACEERTALMLFYRGLADLKLLGMVKQSKKKVDHLAKSAWSGL
jgi:origin recognition complex subunit 3